MQTKQQKQPTIKEKHKDRIVFKGTVRKLKNNMGLFGTITSRSLTDFIDKKVEVKIIEIVDD